MASSNGPGDGAGPQTQEIEQAICRITGVQAARIVTGPQNRVSEVHILASRERAPKQLVRDIQSVALTNFGVTLDYRTISVVQLDQPGAVSEAPGGKRPAIRRLTAETTAASTEVKIVLAAEDGDRSGTARGPATSGLRLVAQAVVDAVGGLVNVDGIEVEWAEIARAGSREVGLVLLRLLTSRGDHAVSGSAIVRKDPADAIARAALAAVNRFLHPA
jgi:hypothetical protein